MPPMITIYRCALCNVLLGTSVDIQKKFCLGVLCDMCNFRSRPRMGRYCKCTHDLFDHKYIHPDSDAPSPCTGTLKDKQKCTCVNFMEVYE